MTEKAVKEKNKVYVPHYSYLFLFTNSIANRKYYRCLQLFYLNIKDLMNPEYNPKEALNTYRSIICRMFITESHPLYEHWFHLK